MLSSKFNKCNKRTDLHHKSKIQNHNRRITQTKHYTTATSPHPHGWYIWLSSGKIVWPWKGPFCGNWCRSQQRLERGSLSHTTFFYFFLFFILFYLFFVFIYFLFFLLPLPTSLPQPPPYLATPPPTLRPPSPSLVLGPSLSLVRLPLPLTFELPGVSLPLVCGCETPVC